MNESIEQAVAVLHQGGLVGIPTETVYGLAADASSPEALKKIFAAKGRPIDHPLIVHIGELEQLTHWAMDISEDAWLLAKHYWPGPLTLILKKVPHVSDIITGGQDSIGIRIPNHPITLAVLKQFGGGVAAPSANRFGRISPTTAEAVIEELGDRVDLVLEGGQCQIGVESTIIDMRHESPRILRPGMISSASIEEILQRPLLENNHTLRVSGALESHYAPETYLQIMNVSDIEKSIHSILDNEKMAFMVRENSPCVTYIKNLNTPVSLFMMPNDAESYAYHFYQILRAIDKQHFSKIWIEELPEQFEWEGVKDRIKRATNKKRGKNDG